MWFVTHTDNVMWFLEQVTIICLAQFIMLPFTYTKPHTYLNNNEAKGNNKHSSKNYLTSVMKAGDSKNSDTNSQSILKAFNFHDIEYPVAATPRPHPFYFQDFNDNQCSQRNFMSDASNIKLNSDLKSARNRTFNNYQKFFKPIIKSNANKPKGLSVLPREFIFGSEFRTKSNFPEVEYPLSAKDTWKPNYWNIPSVCKDLNALIFEDLHLNQNHANIYPTRNSGIGKSGKCRSFLIKSYSDIMMNKELLKQVLKNKANNTSNAQNNSTCQNDFIINGEENFAANDIKTLPIEHTEAELHTTAIPYCMTPIDILPDCGEFNIDFSNTFSVFNESKQNNNIPSTPYQYQPLMKTDNPFIVNNAFNFDKKITLLENKKNGGKDISPDHIQEMNYDQFNIIDGRKPDTGGDLCGLDDDYTTDIYSEEKNIGWFSYPITTPTPFSSTTDDITWKNCQIITPCEINVDELEDNYISV